MTQDVCISPELQALLDATPNTDGLAAQIRADIEELERDPVFVADFLKMQFVEDIFEAMHIKGINRNQLAQKLGKSRQYVGRILNENANFTLETLAEIACALDMRVAARMYTPEERMIIAPIVKEPQLTLFSEYVTDTNTISDSTGAEDAGDTAA